MFVVRAARLPFAIAATRVCLATILMISCRDLWEINMRMATYQRLAIALAQPRQIDATLAGRCNRKLWRPNAMPTRPCKPL